MALCIYEHAVNRAARNNRPRRSGLPGRLDVFLEAAHVNRRRRSTRSCSGRGTKGPRGMPRCQEPKKGAARRRNARVSGLARGARGARMGKPGLSMRQVTSGSLVPEGGTGGSETSQYPEEEEATAMP